ncbi:hypothetical protein P7K49_011679, partial [Saguinus oedipus]
MRSALVPSGRPSARLRNLNRWLRRGCLVPARLGTGLLLKRRSQIRDRVEGA